METVVLRDGKTHHPAAAYSKYHYNHKRGAFKIKIKNRAELVIYWAVSQVSTLSEQFSDSIAIDTWESGAESTDEESFTFC